jgi:hypothetical protein
MNLEKRHQLWIGIALGASILATHGHHFATALNLPPATWVAFFLAGFYLRSAKVFAALLAEVVVIDVIAVTLGGVSAFCVSPAYGFLLPAYGTLWLAGRWFAKHYSFSFRALPALVASLAVSVTLAEIFTSGGFYFFSGRFADTSLAEFGSRLMQYFPYTLNSFAFWAGIALIVHIAFALVQGNVRKQA